MKKLELTNRQIGRLTVVQENGRNKRGLVMWRCVCRCGNEVTVVGVDLFHKRTRSCGCLRTEKTKARSKVHGEASGGRITPELKCWYEIKARCRNKKDRDYGGRGISVCEKWIRSYQAFLSDMGRRPIGKYSIDRIDVNGDYEPSNCRWATDSQQNRNRRPFKIGKHA